MRRRRGTSSSPGSAKRPWRAISPPSPRRSTRSPHSASMRPAVFGFWDWVGGRYSLWSAIGLPLMLAIGREAFGEFLAGARAMDAHFKNAPVGENLPMMLGLLGIWHRLGLRLPEPGDHSLRAEAVAVSRLSAAARHGIQRQVRRHKRRTAFLRLRTHRLGRAGHQRPARLLPASASGHRRHSRRVHHRRQWPRAGTQASASVADRQLPGAIGSLDARPQHRRGARANCLPAALPMPRPRGSRRTRHFPATRPSITLVHDKLTPFSLGRLIALYEHRVFVEATIFGINAFDQWGVELGQRSWQPRFCRWSRARAPAATMILRR